VLPSSHSSLASLTPFPQSRVQLEQPSPSTLLPSSHCYVPLLLTVPSPQYSFLHVEEQPSPSTVLPSSHYSFVFIVPSPHTPGWVLLFIPELDCNSLDFVNFNGFIIDNCFLLICKPPNLVNFINIYEVWSEAEIYWFYSEKMDFVSGPAIGISRSSWELIRLKT